MDVSHIDSILVVAFEVCVQMTKSVRREGFYLFLFQRMRHEMRRLRREMRRLRREMRRLRRKMHRLRREMRRLRRENAS